VGNRQPEPFSSRGPFDLANQNAYFGGWPRLRDDSAIVIAFPVEGWEASTAVLVREVGVERLTFAVFGARGHEERAREQALATLSLDVDAVEWPEVGRRDERIGALQERYGFLRPVLFHSPYEAAANFIIGHRISMKQSRAIRTRMAEEIGASIEVDGQTFAAFPDPRRLLKLSEFPGLNAKKIERLHGVADAALSGILDRRRLRAMRMDAALQALRTIDGIGPFFASGILNRGAGVVDDITDDDLTKYAVQVAYELEEAPSQADTLRIAENWRPFRMWAEVLLHVWLRREVGLPGRAGRRP